MIPGSIKGGASHGVKRRIPGIRPRPAGRRAGGLASEDDGRVSALCVGQALRRRLRRPLSGEEHGVLARAALGARRALRGRCGDAARGRGGQSRRAHHRGGHASGAARAEEAPGVDSRGSAYRRRHQSPVPAHMAIAPSPRLKTEALLGLLQETS